MAGLVVPAARGRARAFSTGSAGVAVGGLLAAAAGGWLVIGALAWPALRSQPVAFLARTPFRTPGGPRKKQRRPGGELLALVGGIALGLSVVGRDSRPLAPPR